MEISCQVDYYLVHREDIKLAWLSILKADLAMIKKNSSRYKWKRLEDSLIQMYGSISGRERKKIRLLKYSDH